MTGGKHPWYVFKGNTIPVVSDAENSIVRIEDCPTPSVLQKAFEQTAGENMRNKKGVEGRKVFVNAQWALGGEGTGAPVRMLFIPTFFEYFTWSISVLCHRLLVLQLILLRFLYLSI